MIPKKIHYVWVGGPLPELQKHYILTWQIHNPDYKLVRWSEDNIDFSRPTIRQAYQQRRWSKVADIVRLMAVHAQGGIYLDTDFQVRRPLDRLLQHRSFWSFQFKANPTDLVGNGVFGAEPGHWFLGEAIDRVLSMRRIPFGLERPTRTGPKLITGMFNRYGLRGYSEDGVQIRDVFICPTHVFFPFGPAEEFTEACVTPDTLAVHFWEKSWAKDIPKVVRMALAAKARLVPRHG